MFLASVPEAPPANKVVPTSRWPLSRPIVRLHSEVIEAARENVPVLDYV